jgi:hypothetical protein
MELFVELVNVYYMIIGVVVLGIIAILSLLLIVMCSFTTDKKSVAWFATIVFALIALPGAAYMSLMLTGRL